MIVLDTNVMSELMRPGPHAGVVAWVAAQPRGMLYTTSITRAEILYGIAALPEGRRRNDLALLVEAMFDEDVSGRIPPFTADAAPHCPRIVAARPLNVSRHDTTLSFAIAATDRTDDGVTANNSIKTASLRLKTRQHPAARCVSARCPAELALFF